MEELLNFYDIPEYLWKKLRTTNAIERVFMEVRIRTRVISCFINAKSVERNTYGVFRRLNDKWKDSYEKITQFS